MYSVLLVDDEPLAIQGLQLMIEWEKYGFRVDASCDNGEEAVRMIRQSRPDLVVTDIRMPVMDGLEMIEETRRSGNDSTLFVITSGFHDFEYARKAMRLGVSHYLTKPVMGAEAEEILAKLRHELGERERKRAIREAASGYAIRHALSVLLYGVGQEDPEADETLSQLSGKADSWTYLRVVTDAEYGGTAREEAEKLAEEHGCCFLVDTDRETFGLVCGTSGAFGGLAGFQAFAGRLYRKLRAAAAGRIAVAAGCTVDRLDDLPRSFGSANEAGRFCFFGDHDAPVYYEDIKDKTLSFDPGALKTADALAESVEAGDPDGLVSSVREAFRTFEARMMLPELVGIFTMQVVLRVAGVYKELGGDPNALLRESEWRGLGKRARHSAELEKFLIAFCLQSQTAVSALQARQSGGTIAKVADFLQLHYREPLTIKEVAERFYLNPVYLGQLFTRKYGRGILEYIHDLRIDEAVRLLREEAMTTGAVAESLGYSSYQHFLKQFEKRLGVKPTDFKTMAKENGRDSSF